MGTYFAVLVNGRVITDGEGRPFSLKAAKKVVLQYENAEVVEIHQHNPLFDLARPSLLRHKNWLSNGFVLVQVGQMIELTDYPKIGELVNTLSKQKPVRLRKLTTCPAPNEFSLSAPMHVFIPGDFRPPYRWQVKNLVCVSDRYLRQIDEDWTVGNLRVIYRDGFSVVIALFEEGDLTGACAPIETRHKEDRLRNLIDAALGNTDW